MQEILQNKAREIERYLTSSDYHCTYSLIQNGINFMISLVGREARFTLYYKPTKGTWNFYSVDEWTKSEIQPKLNLMLGLQASEVSKHISSHEPVVHKESHSGPSLYFEAALECFRLLQPFAEEYIDFSIIYEQAKMSIKGILDDPRYAYFNRQALQSILVVPSSYDFTGAKEYLSQCLTLCQIQIQL